MIRIKNILLIILIAGVILYSGFLLWRKSQPEPVRYEIVESSYGHVERLAVFTGRIVPNEEVEVKPHIGGVLTKIFVSEGDYVRKGDVIGQIEVVPDVATLSAMQAVQRQSTIGLEEQKRDYDRSRELYRERVISKADMQKAEAAYQSAERDLKRSEDDLNIVKRGYYDSEKTGNIMVRSTISGIVLSIPVKTGTTVVPLNLLSRGTTIATVGDIRTSEFVFNADETEIDHLYVGMPVKLVSGVGDHVRLEGAISAISLLGKEVKGAAFYEVKASIDAPQTVKIPTRSSARAQISIARKENVVLVPESALSFENDSTFVYIAQKGFFDYTYIRRHVELGLSDKRYVEVVSGIEAPGIRLRGNRIAGK